MRFIACLILCSQSLFINAQTSKYKDSLTLINKRDSVYRGIWYSIGPTKDEYAFKYAGGLGTYPSNHYPFSVYVPSVDKTFFCYGGTDETGKTLLHNVSFYDHKTKSFPRPTIVLDKKTDDAHDNPVIQVDKDGYIWLFSTSHGVQRPSCISRSVKPYDISTFQKVNATKSVNGNIVPMDNFSYLQVYYTETNGFLGLFTHYENKDLPIGKKQARVIAWMTSRDGVNWSEWKDLASIEEGHYQSSGQLKNKVGSAFNYHPATKGAAGLDYRTNLYYLYTDDFGKSWKTANGKGAVLPLTEIKNDALVIDYASTGDKVYVNDVNFDSKGNPVILYLTIKGPDPGPKNGMKQWYTANWTGDKWNIQPITRSDNNYDMGSIYVDADNTWRIVAPTQEGPQAFNTGGEIVMWISRNAGATWKVEKQLTKGSKYNHSYPRRPVNASKDFFALWADGDGRQFSPSHLYYSDKSGNVKMIK